MMMMSRAFPLAAAGFLNALFIVILIYCCCSTADVSLPIVAAAGTIYDDGGSDVLLPQDPGEDSHQKRMKQKRRRGKHKSLVPSVKVDCAARHFALEFAVQKLPWSSPSQKQHISDALRLQECPVPSPPIEEPEEEEEEEEGVSIGSSRAKKETSTAQIRRSRRTKEYSKTKDGAMFPTVAVDPKQQQENTLDGDNDYNNNVKTILFYVDPSCGDDKAPGTLASPLKTIRAALALSGRLRSSQSDARTIVLRGGRYHLEEPLRLDSRDNQLTIKAYHGENPILSGGDPLSLTLRPTVENPSVYSAKLPNRHDEGVSSYNFTMLFLDRSEFNDEDDDDIRLVWAREPNGHPERDLQPDGYATANGTDSGTWPDPEGAIHFVIGKDDASSGTSAARNSTVYPWHGEDLDPRGGGNWLHFGGTGNRFVGGKGYWNGSVPMGLNFHGATLNTSSWTPEGYARSIAHVFHNGFWGNWQFEIDSVTTNGGGGDNEDGDGDGDGSQRAPRDGKLSFKRGGWQEGRGGGIRDQPFFVEGVKEALDVPGEWWLDVPNQIMYYYPHGNETTATTTNRSTDGSSELPDDELKIDFVAPRLKRLIEVVGENSRDRTADGITLRGLTFAHTATTFMEPYEVPSPGDWSIHRGGAVFLENAQDVSIQECLFLRTGGNAVVVSGYAKRTHIANTEFAWIGDSAIVTLGRITMADGFTVDSYPEDTLIEGNHFHEIGIHGKQTSALFSALSCKTTFAKNVLYNGPRAGINLNDQFCHGHSIMDNLIFNWVRETQDHGPINTWDRAMYIQKADPGTENGIASKNPTLIPKWTHIERNFIMNGPSGNRDLGNLFPTIDNDDGSSYFYIAKNLLVYGGGKNYLGHDKIWISNLLVYPGRWSGEPCAQIWGGKNHYFVENTCLIAPGDPPIGLDGSTKGFACKIDWKDPKNNLQFVGKTATNSYYLDRNDVWGFGCGNRTSPDHWFAMEELQKHGWELGSTVRDSKVLTADGIIDLAKKLLAMD